MSKRLVVLAGPDEGRVFKLEHDTLLLGRSRATETHLLDPHVSKVHCQVQVENGQYILSDFDSAGGTFVNGKKVDRHTLQTGDLIRIGNTRMQFEDDADTLADTPPTVVAPSRPTQLAAPPRAAGAQAAARVAPPRAAPAALPLAQPVLEDLAGQKLGHYKAGPPLARGRNGILYHARDTRRNLACVLKVLSGAFTQDDAQVKRFVDVMRKVMPLRHPNLLKLYGAGKTGPYCWIAEEYVPGESLAAVVNRIETAGMLDWRQVLRVAIYLTRALNYAHGKNVLHLSVTPQNVLLGHDLRNTKLTDLMLADAIQGDPTLPISAAGVPAEELSYMPPERTHGPGRPTDARTDLYSLGATTYAMFTGHAPLVGNTVQELVKKVRQEMPVTLRTHQLGVPDELEAMLMRLMAKDPEQRYPSAQKLLGDLEAFAKKANVTV